MHVAKCDGKSRRFATLLSVPGATPCVLSSAGWNAECGCEEVFEPSRTSCSTGALVDAAAFLGNTATPDVFPPTVSTAVAAVAGGAVAAVAAVVPVVAAGAVAFPTAVVDSAARGHGAATTSTGLLR